MPAPRRHKVLWSSAAAGDLEAILDFIAIDNPGNVKVLVRLRQTATKLRTFPNRGRVVPELHEQGITTYRQLVRAPWRIIYRVAGREVHVLAVFDSRRNVEDLLLERLTRND